MDASFPYAQDRHSSAIEMHNTPAKMGYPRSTTEMLVHFDST